MDKNKKSRVGFKQTKQDSKQYYLTWMKEVTKCPLFENPIRISRKGWDHIYSGSKGRARLAKDKHRKLCLLKAAKKVIKEAKQCTLEVRNNTKYYILKESVLFNGKLKEVKVLLKEDRKGNKYFFSVM